VAFASAMHARLGGRALASNLEAEIVRRTLVLALGRCRAGCCAGDARGPVVMVV
jgi:hypothetical protein